MKDIQRSLRAYFIDWDAWCEGSIVFDFASLKPIQAGWKVPDEKSLGDKVTELLPLTLQAYISTVNDRKIALLATKDLVENIPVIQLMQMRPKSKDKRQELAHSSMESKFSGLHSHAESFKKGDKSAMRLSWKC